LLLRRHADRLRGLRSDERREVETLLYAYARWRSRVDAWVNRAVAKLPKEAPHITPRRRLKLVRASLFGLTEAGVSDARTGGSNTGLTASELEALQATATDPPTTRDPAVALAERCAFPAAVVSELILELGEEEAKQALDALNQRAPLMLRARPPAEPAALVAALADSGIEARVHGLIPGAVKIEQPARLERHQLLRDRQASIQDAASQLAVQALGVEPGQTVVDYCAGGGGKAEAIGDWLHGQGRLVLIDRDRRRLARARRRVTSRSGLRLDATTHDGLELPPTELIGAADRVLVDAPCSGLGTVRRHPELKWRYDTDAVRGLAARQLGLVVNAARCLAVGGRLLYATCSLRREENQAIADALQEKTQLRPLPLEATLGGLAATLGARGGQLTLWPHRHDCDGFFLALFERI